MYDLGVGSLRYHRTVTALTALVALGALWGGAGLVLQPDGSTVGAPLALLQYSPFQDFLVPGLLLFSVIGLGTAAATGLALLRHRLAPAASASAGTALIVWIAAQIYLLQLIHWLHLIYLLLGCAILLLSWGDARRWLSARR
jgi:hypothetical protein